MTVWYVCTIPIMLQHTIHWCCRRRWDEYQVVMVGVDVVDVVGGMRREIARTKN